MGVTYKQGKIMKNIYKSFALLCMGLAATACIEENFENNGPKYDTTPGNEIVFSATAGIENGMPEPETRTVYGDQVTANGKNWIEINWVDNKDMVQIVSPEAAGPEVGHYLVTGASQQSGFNQTHRSASLTKLGDGALQWSESEDYTFYGVYPSFAYDTDTKHGATASLSKEGVFTGSMPIDQNYSLNEDGSAANGWIAAPDMRYAFMTAMDTYKREPADGYDDETSTAERAINLEFKSMVTALQFDIKPGEINYKDPVTNETVTEMEVISVSLLSNKVDPEKTGKSISGSFSYNIPEESYSATKGTRMVSLHFDNKSVKLSSLGKSLNVTFFILPEDFDSTDKLQLQIIFKLGATQVSRIATINTSNAQKPILGGKKYIFNNVQLPALKTDVVSSSWWDTLDPNTILPQVSIPVAANVFANSNEEYLGSSISPSLTQQTLTLEQLWAMGVRGFEIQTRSCTKEGDSPEAALKKSIGTEPVIAAGKEVNMTFGAAFEKLASLLMKSKDQSGNPTECLFIVCTYSALSDGYNPYVFVSNLFNYLSAYCNSNSHGITTANFEQITDATTVGDLRGKIAIIIRPGDDERWLYETSTYSSGWNYSPLTDPYEQLKVTSAEKGLTGLIPSKLESDWWGRVMLISDWGAESYDVWDRRYGSEYAREAVFHQNCPDSRKQDKEYIEDYLYGIASGTSSTLGATTGYVWSKVTTDNNFNNYGEEPTKHPEPLAEFNYAHSISNGNTAYIQEWMRVVKTSKPVSVASKTNSGNKTLWVQWKESLDEKKSAIRTLFNKSVETKGQPLNDIYINVLSGYLVDPEKYSNDTRPGFFPQKDPMDGFTKNTGTLIVRNNGNVTNHGKGGDFKGLANELNQYVYDLLSKEPGTEGALSQTGPWGLVMMDHINADDKSADLVELIMMNNFKFPLVTKDGVTPANYNATYSNGGEAISFK